MAARQAAEVERDRLAAGYDALGESQLDEAEALFRRAVKSNLRDADALAGLGNALLKKESFDEAKVTFEKVKAAAPKRPEGWQDSLRAAEFWSLVRGAEKLRGERACSGRGGAEGGAGAVAQGRAARGAGARQRDAGRRARREEAQALFEAINAVLNTSARCRGSSSCTCAPTTRRRRWPRTSGGGARHQGGAARHAGFRWRSCGARPVAKRKTLDYVGAEGRLDSARALDPENRNVLLDQAYNWLAQSKTAEARGAIDALAKLGHDKESKIAAAWVFSASSASRTPSTSCAACPRPSSTTARGGSASARDLQADIAQTVKMATRGKMLSAQARLTELQRQTREQPELTGLVANAWADIGKYDQALAVMYSVVDEGGKVAPTLKLQLAGILHKADREADLLDVLHELEVEPDSTPSEKQGLADLKVAYAIKRAYVAREGGLPGARLQPAAGPARGLPERPAPHDRARAPVRDGRRVRGGRRAVRARPDHTPRGPRAGQGAHRAAIEQYAN